MREANKCISAFGDVLCYPESTGKKTNTLTKPPIWWKVWIKSVFRHYLGLPVFRGEDAGSMHSDCLNICSGNELLLWIPCGSTYTSAAAAEKPRSNADNLSQTLCSVVPSGSLLFTVKWAFVRSARLESSIWIKRTLNSNYSIMSPEQEVLRALLELLFEILL